MKTSISQKISKNSGLLAAVIFQEDLKKTPSVYPDAVKKFLKIRSKEGQFEAAQGSKVQTYLDHKDLPSQLLVIGGGERGQFNAKQARELGGTLGKQFKSLKQTEVTLVLSADIEKHAQELIEGILLVQYDLQLCKTNKKKKQQHHLKKLNLVTAKANKELKQQLEKAQTIVSAVHYVRDLVNQPANVINSEYLATEAKKIAKENKYKKHIFGDKELKKMKAGGILSVNKGCQREAKLLVLAHQGGSKKDKPIILVGKGVIFDTGGYNIKSGSGMATMHQDMAGGATVLGIMSIVKKIGLKKNIIGIVPAVENLINEDAYRPSDIITMLSGTTVEVTNTDAEGRLILADALHYASNMNPELIISIATLTGAAFTALGHRYCALLGNNDMVRADIQVAGKEVDELAWALPIHDDYRKQMDSRIADCRNYDFGSGGGAGTAKAASFLERFVGENKWCHLDIGGTAFTSHPKAYETKGATAHGVRILLQFLENY